MSDFKAKMHQIRFPLGSDPDPVRGAYSAPPGPLAVFKEPTSNGREGKGKEGRAVRRAPISCWHSPPEGRRVNPSLSGLRSAIRRHHPPQKAVLSQICCFGSVRWCCLRSCWTVLTAEPRDAGRPSCLLQSAGGEVNRILLASALSSMRICPNRVNLHDWIIAVSLGCFVRFRTSSFRTNWYQLAVWLSGNALASINVVALRQTRLVLGRVTVCGRVNHIGM